MESSEGSSSEVNSPVSLEKASIAEGGEIQEIFDSEEKACQMHSNTRDFAVGSSSVSKVHQVCVIITEAEEGNNSDGSKKIDRQVDKNQKKGKEKVHVSAGEWRMIKSAVNHGTEVPEGSRREVLMGYQYALYQHKKKLREERDMVFQDNNSISREEYWEDYSEDSEYSREKHGDPKHNREATARDREEGYSRSPTPQPEEEEDDLIQKTPEAALAAAQAYLLATRPEHGDPREDMHRAAIRSLGIVEGKIRGQDPEIKSTNLKGKEKSRYNLADNEYSESSEEKKRQKRKEDARSIIAQARVNKSRHAWREENYEDDDKDMGALCFTRRVRKTRVPKGFKLPHDQNKYDGSQEPNLWLSDYLQAVQILGGTKATAMQSLQLHLTGAARSWLNTLPDESIGSWGELESQFTRNFRSTYKRPASLEEVKACVQKKGETLRSYIQRWSIIKNSAEDVSDERAEMPFWKDFVAQTWWKK
jgi:hypothetical protein